MAEMKIVVFRIGGQDYAADIREVREVIRPPVVTPLPNPHPPLVGVFNLRGQIVTALEGTAALGLPPASAPPARAVVFHAQGRTVGLLVEAANHVLTVDEGSIRPPPDAHRSQPSRGIIIHDGRPIVLLDVPFLLGQGPRAEARPSP